MLSLEKTETVFAFALLRFSCCATLCALLVNTVSELTSVCTPKVSHGGIPQSADAEPTPLVKWWGQTSPLPSRSKLSGTRGMCGACLVVTTALLQSREMGQACVAAACRMDLPIPIQGPRGARYNWARFLAVRMGDCDILNNRHGAHGKRGEPRRGVPRKVHTTSCVRATARTASMACAVTTGPETGKHNRQCTRQCTNVPTIVPHRACAPSWKRF